MERATKNLRMNVLGIMSGTSIDSVDYALCEVSEKKIELRKLWTAPFPKKLQQSLHEAARGDLKSWEFCQLHHDLGRFYAAHVTDKTNRAKPTLVGLHGQTVFHHPSKKNPATFQLGEPAYLVEKLRVPVVNNFRVADLAAGGQGAPLATLFHRFVFAQSGQHVCVNNLGGISNVTSLDWKRESKPKVLAFDTGPANMLIDFAIRHFSNGKKNYDFAGEWAARGTASEDLLKRWLRHPYFGKKPPKSTGRELFGEPFFKKAIQEMRGLSQFDVATTFTEYTARSLALNYEMHLLTKPDKIILTGGGASNPTLVQAIRKQFGCVVQSSDELNWPVQSIEPAAFALLAFLRIKSQRGNLPETTGANRAVICGQTSEP
ncbi:MAG: anhydro-N-acetylmuramic acid kinase [Verrucomicrobiota bacterium]